jgi:hypothetical protein
MPNQVNTYLKLNGGTHQICSAGVNDGKFFWKIRDGLAPYKVELKLNDPNPPMQWGASPVFRTITDIPAATGPDDVNCIISDLPPGKYKYRIYDAGDPSIQMPNPGAQQMTQGFSDWDVVQAPLCTISCKVKTKGIPTTVYFEIGETDSYGLTVLAGVPTVPGEVEMHVHLSAGDYSPTSILKPNKTYHFRAKLVSEGIPPVYGEDKLFMTPTILPEVQTLDATDIQ